MTLEEMRFHKERLKLTNEQLAQKSGIPVSTVAKVMAGITKNPRYDTRMRMEAVLQPVEETPEEIAAGAPEELTYVKTDVFDDNPVYSPDDDVLMDEDGDWHEPPDPADDCI